MQWGLCLDLAVVYRHREAGTQAAFWAGLQAAGIDYLELSVGSVMGTEESYDVLRALIAAAPIPVRAFNGFLPAAQRVTGPSVDWDSVLEYCRVALTRAQGLGGDVVVLGSAGARSVPAGFDPAQAEQQFCDFCRLLGPVADAANMDIAIEPLNAQEDNLILSVAHGARLVDQINHPRILLLADFYHMFQEQESVSAVAAAGSRLRHTHLADIGRVAPGYAPQGEADFVGFFRALRQSGYAARPFARCSFEGKMDNLEEQTPPMMRLLHARWQQSADA